MKKVILLICGFLCLALGIVGIVLPILPTTPFLLVSAVCFSISSKRMYDFLLRNKLFGAYIRHYREKTGVKTRVKVCTLAFLYVALIVSAILINELIAYIILGIVAVAVTVHILLIRPKK